MEPREPRPTPPINSIESRQAIEACAEEAYREVARVYPEHYGNNPDEIFYQTACQQFSEVMREKLLARGIRNPRYRKTDVTSLSPRSKPHVTLDTREYIIDGTWQQFLKPEQLNKDKKCLILRRIAVVEDLQKAGVPQKLWFIYEA